VAAYGVALAHAPRVKSDDLPTSQNATAYAVSLRFVGEDGQKLRSARIQHSLGRMGVGKAQNVRVLVDALVLE
jgi:hypothetical protein